MKQNVNKKSLMLLQKVTQQSLLNKLKMTQSLLR